MKLAATLFLLQMALAIEIRLKPTPNAFIFNAMGKVNKIIRHEIIEIEVKTEKIENQTASLGQHTMELMDICNNLRPAINCDILKIFLNNKFKNCNEKRNKLNEIRSDDLIKNETIIWNNVKYMNKRNKRISIEIANLKNMTKEK